MGIFAGNFRAASSIRFADASNRSAERFDDEYQFTRGLFLQQS